MTTLWVGAALAAAAVVAPGQAADDEEPVVVVPDRDAAGIAIALSHSVTASTLAAELAALQKEIDGALEPEVKAEVQRFLDRFHGNAVALANAAAILWIQGFPDQALRLAAEAAQVGPADATALNNFAALLADAGYAERAIPLLRYLDGAFPQDPTIQGNLAVSWLNLGASAEAGQIAATVLAREPGHAPANLVAGIIADQAGKREVAAEHFRRAAAGNSSPLARRYLRHHRLKYRGPPGFMAMLPRKEYFSPSGFSPVTAQRTLAEYPSKQAEKEAYDAELGRLIKAQYQIIELESAKAISGGGLLDAGSPYAKLDWSKYLDGLRGDDRIALVRKRLEARIQAMGELRVAYERTPTPVHPEDQVSPCKVRRPIAQAALTRLAEQYDQLVAETLFLWRDLANAQMSVAPYMMPPAAYRVNFASSVAAYLEFVRALNSNLPLLPDPCLGQEGEPIPPYDLVAPGPGDCPFSIEADVVVAKLKMDCKEFEFTFEAGLACSAKKDFVKGETTFTAGVGADADLHGLGKAEVAGQMVMVWDHDNSLSFVGIEAKAEAKLSGIPGLSGTLADDSLDLNRGLGGGHDGASLTLAGAQVTENLVKAEGTTRLGLQIGPRGVEPSLSGDSSAKLFGDEVFQIEMPALKPGQ